MTQDMIAYSVIHIQFIVFYTGLIFAKINIKYKVAVLSLVSASYLISLVSYVGDLGDDFYYIQLEGLLFLTPLVAWSTFFFGSENRIKSFFIVVPLLFVVEFAIIIGLLLLMINLNILDLRWQ